MREKNRDGGKIQGEGDYEAVRRFNRQERDFVRRKFGRGKVSADFDLEKMADREANAHSDQPRPGITERDAVKFRRRIIDTPRQRH